MPEELQPNPSETYNTNPEICLTNQPTADNPFRMSDIPADVNLAKSLQQELNEIASRTVVIYLLLDTEIDPLLGETKSAMYGKPMEAIGQYSPMLLKFELMKWGIDSQDTDFVIIFTRDELMKKCGRLLQQGDLIYTTDIPRLFEVTEQYDDTNFGYQFINQYILCKRKLGDTSFLPGQYKNVPEGETNADAQVITDDQNKNFFSY